MDNKNYYSEEMYHKTDDDEAIDKNRIWCDAENNDLEDQVPPW